MKIVTAAAVGATTIAIGGTPTLPASAALAGACGPAVTIPAPPSVAPGALEQNGKLNVFAEATNTTTTSPIQLDAVAPGRYEVDSDLPAPGPTIPSGTAVSSFLIHSDPVGQPAASPRLTVRLSFSADLLGVAVRAGTLDGSDLLKAPSTTYPASGLSERGLEQDVVAVDILTIIDARTIELSVLTTTLIDEVRVVTRATPTQPAVLDGYRFASAGGEVFGFGERPAFGSPAASGLRLVRPLVGGTSTCSGAGYWLVAGDGGIFAYGDARFLGSTGGIRLNQPVVGMAAAPDASGYWMVATDGGIFNFGSARFFGSLGRTRLNSPVNGMTATPNGGGYTLVAGDGGIFAYGNARFFGSLGNVRLNQPIVGMARTPSGSGYWLVARDGGIFSFGDAGFFGSLGSTRLNQPVVAMKASQSGGGYVLVAADGGVFAFGDARFFGSTGGTTLATPVVGVL